MISVKSFLVSLVCMFVTLLAVGFISQRPNPVVVRTNLENLPMEIAGYRGTEDAFPESVYHELNADKNVYRHYRSGDGRQLDLYIGYYGTAKGGRTGHNPYACLPGAGWAIVDSHKVRIRHPYQSSDVEVNYVQARRNGINTVMLHWYQTAGTTVLTTGIRKNIERFWGRLLHNRNDGAFVQITIQVTDERLKDAQVKVENFAGQVLQLLPRYWPVEK
ncbi:exosortase C-terminal domain/associated protein EpsI [Geobacter sp.]|uniref:exosortase C-terminal domain/associated protein EpsI n=1 Tax=Geobacter sp. TaxID=46610 RepID=UPI00260A9DFC|nr:exosortase C-terminal domain/associated protein EpsI [Geobacter sp.]